MLHKETILPRAKGLGQYCGGIVNWRVALVHYVAKAVGLHIKLEGFPLGTGRNLEHEERVGGGWSLYKYAADGLVVSHPQFVTGPAEACGALQSNETASGR